MLFPKEKDLEQNFNHCPNCNSNMQANYCILQENPEVRMIKCNKCKLSYADKIPKTSFLNNLYDPAIYKSNLTSNSKNTYNLAKRIFRKLCFEKKEINILDYGGGNGNLSNELIKLFAEKKIKAKSLVVDVFDNCKHENIAFEHVRNFEKNKDKFDIVLASAVLEHLPNFVLITNQLLNKVKLNGFFYCRTPWEFEISKLFKFYKMAWPRHLYDIGGDFWVKYFKNYNNFTIILNETSTSEISKRELLKYVLANILKTVSRLETFIFRNIKYRQPKWPYVGGWDIIVKKND